MFPVTPVAAVNFDTDQLAEEVRFTAWSAAIPQYDLTLPPHASAHDFKARVWAWFFGPVIVTRSVLSGVRMNRTLKRIQLDGVDTYNFIVLTQGSWMGQAGGRELVVGPGQLVAFDLSRPFEADSLPSDSIALVVGRAALERVVRRSPDLHGHVFSGGAADLLTDHLIALVKRLPTMGAEDVPSVTRATLAQLAAALDFVRARDLSTESARAILQRARHYIERHLTEPDLTPSRLAAELGVSRPTLYRSFAPLGGVSAYVQRRRLEAIRFVFVDPDERRSLSELAQLFGFADSAHLATAFRRTYGIAPRDARGWAVRPEQDPKVASEATLRFREWTRLLQAA